MSVEDENKAAQQAALERIRIRMDAYLKLFGPPGNRTPLGAVVLQDLDFYCNRGYECIHMDKEGRMDPFTTIYRDGKKAVAERIHSMIEGNYDDSSSGTN